MGLGGILGGLIPKLSKSSMSSSNPLGGGGLIPKLSKSSGGGGGVGWGGREYFAKNKLFLANISQKFSKPKLGLASDTMRVETNNVYKSHISFRLKVFAVTGDRKLNACTSF